MIARSKAEFSLDFESLLLRHETGDQLAGGLFRLIESKPANNSGPLVEDHSSKITHSIFLPQDPKTLSRLALQYARNGTQELQEKPKNKYENQRL